MELGPQNHNGDGLLGPNSIMVVCMDPLGNPWVKASKLKPQGSGCLNIRLLRQRLRASGGPYIPVGPLVNSTSGGGELVKPKPWPQTLNHRPWTIESHIFSQLLLLRHALINTGSDLNPKKPSFPVPVYGFLKALFKTTAFGVSAIPSIRARFCKFLTECFRVSPKSHTRSTSPHGLTELYLLGMLTSVSISVYSSYIENAYVHTYMQNAGIHKYIYAFFLQLIRSFHFIPFHFIPFHVTAFHSIQSFMHPKGPSTK